LASVALNLIPGLHPVGVLGWLVNTTASAVLGLVIGAIVVAAAHGRKKH
jgi:predicted DNA repair protein MutK